MIDGGMVSLGYKDVALLDNFIKGKQEIPYVSKGTAENVRRRAWNALVKEYMTNEDTNREKAENNVDALISCHLVEQNSEEQIADLN